MDRRAKAPAAPALALKPWQRPLLGIGLCALWLLLCGLQVVLHDNDALRLVQVRDLLAGQAWFDMAQPRLGLEGGTTMQGSRLVDAPLAGLLLLFTPLVGQGGAEAALLILWPAMLFGASVLALSALCRKLGGARAGLAGGFFAAVMLAWGGMFDPGSLGAYTIQILLLAGGLAGFVCRNDHRRNAAMAGLALGLSLGVGVESVPLVGVIFLAFAISWGLRGDVERDAAVSFSTALAASLALIFLLIVPAQTWAGGFCDALSRDLALPVLLGCGGLAAAAACLPGQSRTVRLAALACLAAGITLAALRYAPACLSIPQGVPASVFGENWLLQQADTLSLIDAPAARKGFFSGGVIGFLIAVSFALRGPARPEWLTLSAILGTALAMAAIQTRDLALVGAVGVIPAAVLTSRLMEGRVTRAPLVAAAAVVLSVPIVPSTLAQMGLSPVKTGIAAPVSAVQALGARPTANAPCSAAPDLHSLADLPPGTVAAPPFLGAHILLHTPHRVLAAHAPRNRLGLLAQHDLATAPPEQTLRFIQTYGVDYIVRCAENRRFEQDYPALAAHMTPGRIASFLKPVPAAGPLSIYRTITSEEMTAALRPSCTRQPQHSPN